ncbi:MAG: T9SS type A sorting domain-containing protein [Ignavibacteria bacterium]|nr:T9SS type A sorting domain-containing protein [Ignavibacteria bacterium]
MKLYNRHLLFTALLFFFTLLHTPCVFAQVINVSLEQNALNVQPNATIQVTFNRAMNPATFNDTTSFIVTGRTSGRYRGSFSFSSEFSKTVIPANTGNQSDVGKMDSHLRGNDNTKMFNNIATFTPNIPLKKGDEISVNVSNKITDANNVSILPNTSQFTVKNEITDGAFAAKVDYATGDNPSSVSVSDIDGDIVVANAASHTVSVLKNVNDTFTITASAGSNGTISPSGDVSVDPGANQQFTFTPNTGYSVDSVFVDGSFVGSLVGYTFNNVTENHTISVEFKINTFTIFASAGSNGTISPSGNVSVDYGASQQFTFTPGTGYYVESVSVDSLLVDSLVGYTFNNVTENHTISVEFNINTFTITASAGINGTISPSGDVSVDYGASQQFTFTPNTGYSVDSVFVDGSFVDSLVGYTFNNVTANHTISVKFKITFTITASAGSNGTISPSGNVNVNYGANQQFTFTPNTGYSVDSVFVDGLFVGSLVSYTFNNVIANHTISVKFKSSVSPVQNALNVQPNATIQVAFAQAINTTTFNDTSSFLVYGQTSGRCRGTFAFTNSNTVVTFTPNTPFMKGDIITVNVTNKIKNGSDIVMTPLLWQFTVVANATNGAFAAKVDYATGSNPYSVSVSDINGDGDGDIVTANYLSNTVSVLKNNGDGTFTAKVDYTTGSNPFSVSVSDIDGDGDGDIVVVNNGSNTVSVLKNNGDGTFTAKVDYTTEKRPVSVSVSDIDGDGDGDIVTANYLSNTVSVLKNNGDGTFTANVDYATGTRPVSVSVSDIDGDGDGDIVTANWNSNTVSVLKNNGDGTFTAKVDYTTEKRPVSVSVSNIDGDGDGDMVVANWGAHTVSVLKNNGDGTYAEKFDYATGSSPSSVSVSDIDGDGDGDIVTANYTSNTVSVLKNNGDGTYAEKVDDATGTRPVSVSVSDIDGDGDGDIVVANSSSSGTVSVLKNVNNISLVAYYPFSGNANDSSEYSNNGTNNGATPTTDRFGNANSAYSFNESNDSVFVSAAANSFPTGNNSRTISFWIYSSNMAQVTKDLLGWGAGGNSQQCWFVLGGGGVQRKITFWGYNNDLNSTMIFNDNTWYHIVFTHDGSTSTFYINGVNDTSASRTYNTASNSTFRVGSDPTTSQHNPFNGILDDIRIYNHALTLTQVDSLYHLNSWPPKYTISATAGANGSISPSGNVSVTYGLSQQFTFTPGTGYSVDSVFVDGVFVDSTDGYTFYNVTAIHTISVTFKEYEGVTLSTLPATSVGGRRARLNGYINPNGIRTAVTFQWGTTTEYGNTIAASPSPVSGNTMVSVVSQLVGLDTNTTYHYRVVAANELSGSVYGYDVTFTTYHLDSIKFRTFSQEDLKTPAAKVKKVKNIPRPQSAPTAGNVLDTLFVTGQFKKIKDKTSVKYPGGMVLGIVQTVKDSMKRYGWFRIIGSSKDVQKFLTHAGSARGYDSIGGKIFSKELKNPKVDKYNNLLVGELLALKVNIAMSQDSMTNPDFGNLIYDNPVKADTFVTQRLTIQGKTLSQISAYCDTMLTYYKRYYTFTPSEEYNKLASALIEINAAFRAPFDTVSWNPFILKDSIPIDQVEFLRRGTSKENTIPEISFEQTEPEKIFLMQNYPNPFNPTTTIRFEIPVGAIHELPLQTTLKIYNVLGQEVATLLNNEQLEEGEHEVQFDASGLTSGVYFYKLSTPTFSQTRKLLLMK